MAELADSRMAWLFENWFLDGMTIFSDLQLALLFGNSRPVRLQRDHAWMFAGTQGRS
jgi:hypothetical protein